jgi:hypothetical protein
VALRKFLAFATVLFVLIDLILIALMASYALNDQKDPQFDIRQPASSSSTLRSLLPSLLPSAAGSTASPSSPRSS